MIMVKKRNFFPFLFLRENDPEIMYGDLSF